MSEKIFVFGTLRKGQPRNYLLEKEKFLGYGFIEGFELYYIKNLFPGIVQGEGKVFGEVYEVSEDKLYQLDEVENVFKVKDVDVGLSKRARVKVKLNNSEEIDAWCYIFIQDLENSIKIESGDWLNFINQT
ncbi:MAG: gamma-glutamylcyclotransferase family protein [Brevinematia bacterium]|jgi:gamma-glutamylcyclotransferase (GGCT)/AIG2-like uncharacterized protein YtfP